MNESRISASALINIELLATARKTLIDSIVRTHWTPEQQKLYKELDSAFIMAIKAESEKLES